jgi:D-glycero-alpha-D-manno-heptose-7-phosphate kinase
MYVAKCPLRISLVGGSTDLETFMKKYGRGSVISFTSNLFCYISIHKNNRGKYIINYSKHEEENKIENIKNDIARVVLDYFKVKEPVTISFNTDIMEGGSGLASSSSYLVAAIKAVSVFSNIELSDFEICKLAFTLEKSFNPLTGFQDSFGCGLGGFKRIDCLYGKDPTVKFLNSNTFFSHYKMFLVDAKQVRKSTDILSTINPENCFHLLSLVDKVEEQINKELFYDFENTFKEAWEIKKKSSEAILNPGMTILEKEINLKSKCLKLCGAGGGGFFLAFVDKDLPQNSLEFFEKNGIKIELSNSGVQGITI